MTHPPASEPSSGYDAPAPPAKKASLFEDFLDIFYAPSSVFARRENFSFWIPLLIVSLLLGIIALLNADIMQPIMDAEFERGAAAARASNPQITDQQLEAGRKIGGVMAKVGGFVGTPILILVTGLVLWIAGKFVEARQTLNAALVVAAYSQVPRVIELILNRVQALIVDPSTLTGVYSLSIGLARFLDPDTAPRVLVAIAGRVNLFTIWVTVLLVIGVAVTGKVSRGRAAIVGIIVWVLGALPALATAMRG